VRQAQSKAKQSKAKQSKAKQGKKGLQRAEALQPQSKAAEKFAEKIYNLTA